MNHKKSLLAALLFLAASSAVQAQSRCMASPDPVTVRQPDGSTLTVVGHGNIDVNYAETVDGYTVIRNKQGIYEYAAETIDGDLAPSGVKANDAAERTGAEVQYLAGYPQHLRYSPEKVDRMLEGASNGAINLDPGHDDHGDELKGVSGSFPQKGKRKILLILIQYPDMKAKYKASDFDNLMNQKNYKNIGSFKDFYLKNSYGKLELETDVMGWYTAPMGYKYYANSEGKTRARQLVASAVDSAENAGVDFSEYDNDKDGEVDGVLVIHSGPGAEEGSQNDYIWSHRWTLGGSSARTYDGVEIDNYAVNPEVRDGFTRIVGIGVICHEFGHLLGLPDLYDVTNASSGIGNWSLMAGGCWLDDENTPANNDAWCKVAMGWTEPKVIDAAGFYTLKPSSNDSLVYKVSTPVSSEYFLLENRQFTGFDKELPWKGLAIWHINESVINNTLGNNTVNADKDFKGVDLEEADGTNGLDNPSNRGDAGDLFPGLKNNTAFDDFTSPNAKTYNNSSSGIRIFNIGIISSDSSVKFGFGALPQATFTTTSTSVCAYQEIEFNNNSKFATSYSWDFGDGSATDTTYSPKHSFAHPGVYYVKLTAYDNGTTTADSVKITVNPKALADFDWTANGMTLSVTNKSQNAKSYYWYWGDGKTGYNSTATFNRTYADTGHFDVKLLVIGNGNCNDTLIKTVYISGTTGIADNAQEVGLRAYPNPAEDILYLEFTSPNPTQAYLSVINSIGQALGEPLLVAAGTGANRLTVPLADARPGLYFVKLLLNGNTYCVPVARK